MAIISIPTQIDGINIPGGIFDGPLSELENNGSGFFYKYPRDLDSSTKSHSVFFTIIELQEVELQEVVDWAKSQVNVGRDYLVNQIQGADLSLSNIGNIISSGAQQLWGVTTDLGASAIDATTGLIKEGISRENLISGVNAGAEGINMGLDSMLPVAKFGADVYEKGGQFLTQTKRENIGHIALYMPENFELSSQISYDDNTSLASAMGSLPIIGKYIKTATNFAEGGGNDAMKMALNRAGFVFNPQKQVLFNGIEFRNFSLAFTFTPYSASEAQQVKKIIETFRMYAAPKRNEQLGKNMFWVPPALFELEFRFQGKRNENLPKIKECVIKNIDVNYAPNGWTTHTDGAPVQTTMTIEFQEIILVGREDISSGY